MVAATLYCCATPQHLAPLLSPYLATMCAELVLPMPGGPDSSTAFLVMSLGLACASKTQQFGLCARLHACQL